LIGEQGLGVMYVFLLFLGAATTAAGLALVTSVVMGHDGIETITPGMIAAVGGLLLVGLGLTVRVLQRIEQALATRPMLRPLRPGETAAAGAAAERASGPTPIPFPSRPKTESGARAAALTANAAPAPAEDAASELLREKFPTMVQLENASVVAEADISLLPQAPASAKQEAGARANGAAGSRTNGAAPSKLAPLGADARASGSSARPKGSVFEAFWPKGQRTRKEGGPAPAQVTTPSLFQAELAQANEAAAPEPPPEVDEREPLAQPPVSVLKSGVVEGMAYTLYSDGSIEAQFPQGMLRFGSINELRNHIESNA
jgi:hypothetical protein